MKLSRQFTIFGSAIFCVVIFSLYLMLDRGHLDSPKSHRREGSFPQVSGTGAAAERDGKKKGAAWWDREVKLVWPAGTVRGREKMQSAPAVRGGKWCG